MTHLRRLRETDIEVAHRLSTEAGWNQTRGDWQRWLSMAPEGCWVAEQDGKPIGTVTTSQFERVGWIGMLLVKSEFRGKGIGTSLMAQALSHLEQRGVTSIRLDATPLGEPLYRTLGFAPQFRVHRWAGQLVSEDRRMPSDPVGGDGLAPFDRKIVGYDRALLLQSLIVDPEVSVDVRRDSKQDVAGYLMLRPGRLARHLGPCLADNYETFVDLFNAARRRWEGKSVVIDVPEPNLRAGAIMQSSGLVIQRTLRRMTRGEMICEQVDHLFASSGPENG